MPFNQGSCNEFSFPVQMLSENIVWTCVKCTFNSLVPLLSWAGFFLKQFPNPAFLREIARIVSTCVFWILWLLILRRPTDKKSIYALGELAINLLSCMIWVSAVPRLGTTKSTVSESWSCDLLCSKKETLFYANLQNLVSFKMWFQYT